MFNPVLQKNAPHPPLLSPSLIALSSESWYHLGCRSKPHVEEPTNLPVPSAHPCLVRQKEVNCISFKSLYFVFPADEHTGHMCGDGVHSQVSFKIKAHGFLLLHAAYHEVSN